MNYEPLPSRFWWARSTRTFVYFIRESTGAVIAVYALGFLLSQNLLLPENMNAVLENFLSRFSWVAFAAACIHSITWLRVTVKISPVALPVWAQWTAFLGFIGIWGGASYFLLTFLYV